MNYINDFLGQIICAVHIIIGEYKGVRSQSHIPAAFALCSHVLILYLEINFMFSYSVCPLTEVITSTC